MRRNEGLGRSVQSISFRLSLNSVVTSVIVLGTLVFAALLAYQAPWSFDMTKDKVFTLSSQSLDVLSHLEGVVNIAAVYPAGREDPLVRSLLSEYSKAGRGKIAVEYADAERDPGVLARVAEGLESGANLGGEHCGANAILPGDKRAFSLTVLSRRSVGLGPGSVAVLFSGGQTQVGGP